MKTVTKQVKNALFIIAILSFSMPLLAQSIITIDNNPNSTTTYQTIQDALDNANDNDIIYVQPSGTSYGSAVIEKPITIVGRSHSENNKVSTISTVTIKHSAIVLKGINISSINVQTNGAPTPPPFVGLEIYECKTGGITLAEFQAFNVIDDVQIRGSLISGFTIYPDATNILISNNIITGNISTYNTSTLVVANNIFTTTSGNITLTNNDDSGTFILFNNMFFTSSASDREVRLNTGDFNLSNCLTYNYAAGSLTFTGTGTFLDSNTLLNTNPLFTDVDPSNNNSIAGASTYNPLFRLDDLTLAAGSPALTGGGGGSEIGLFNNGFIYKYVGNPRGIPTLDIISYDGAVPKNGNINVTVSAKSH